MSDSNKKYFLILHNGERMEIEADYVNLSKFYKNINEDLFNESDEIELPINQNFSIECHKKIYDIYEKITHKDKNFFKNIQFSNSYKQLNNRNLTTLESEFVYDDSESQLYLEMLSFADFLEMESFENFLGKLIAHKICQIDLKGDDKTLIRKKINNLLPNSIDNLSSEEQKSLNEMLNIYESIIQDEDISM